MRAMGPPVANKCVRAIASGTSDLILSWAALVPKHSPRTRFSSDDAYPPSARYGLPGTRHQHRRDIPLSPISQVRCGAAKSVAHHPVRGATGSVRRNLADRTRAMPRAGVMSPSTRSAPAAARHLADVDLPERCNDGFIGFLAPLNDAPSDESRLAQRLNSASPKPSIRAAASSPALVADDELFESVSACGLLARIMTCAFVVIRGWCSCRRAAITHGDQLG